MNNMTTTSAMNRATSKYQAGSIKGTGGHTSFGGGGGFSASAAAAVRRQVLFWDRR